MAETKDPFLQILQEAMDQFPDVRPENEPIDPSATLTQDPFVQQMNAVSQPVDVRPQQREATVGDLTGRIPPGANPLVDAFRPIAGSALQDTALSTAGEAAGRLIGAGAGPTAPVMSPFLGATGAATGLIFSRLASGEPISIGDVSLEFGMSLLPPIVFDPVIAGGRRILATASRAGKRVSADLAGSHFVRRLRNADESIQRANFLFKSIRDEAAQVKLESFKNLMTPRNLSEQQWKVVKQALGKISSGVNNEFPLINETAVKRFTQIREWSPVTQFPNLDKIGFSFPGLTHIRSQLTDQVIDATDSSQKDAINKFIKILNKGIEEGDFLVGGKSIPGFFDSKGVLEKARKGWAIIADRDDFRLALSRKVRQNKDGFYEIDIGSIRRMLDEPIDEAEKIAATMMARQPTLRFELEALDKLVGKLKIPSMGERPPEFLEFIGSLFTKPAARERFLRIALRKRGNFSAEDVVTLLANMGLRGFEAGRNPRPQGSRPTLSENPL